MVFSAQDAILVTLWGKAFRSQGIRHSLAIALFLRPWGRQIQPIRGLLWLALLLQLLPQLLGKGAMLG